jgi:hypothetical protein
VNPVTGPQHKGWKFWQWDPVFGQVSVSPAPARKSSEGKAKAEAIKAKMIARCIVDVERTVEFGIFLRRFEFERKDHLDGPSLYTISCRLKGTQTMTLTL